MNKIRALRLENGMKQSDLAALLNTKPQTVSRYEKGDRGLDVETILRLCEIFGCTADYLLGRSRLQEPGLSDEEESMLLAWRRADDRTRELVSLALQPFREDASSQEAI